MANINEIKKDHLNAYAPWSLEEDSFLAVAYEDFKASRSVPFVRLVAELAIRFARQPGGIRSRIKKLFPEDFPQVTAKDKPVSKKVKLVDEPDVKLNREMSEAFDLLEHTDRHFFLTGKAGTGKSTLLQYFKSHTKKNTVVLAPTGIAALNVQGQTIHSFCGFPPGVIKSQVEKISSWSPKKKLLANLEVMVIDEVSMVRADMLDCIDKFLRLNGKTANLPFGGVQMIFIGDLFQLPPVVTNNETVLFSDYSSPYFFSAQSIQEIDLQFIKLNHVFRQEGDDEFLEILNAVRTNTLQNRHLDVLNSRISEQSSVGDYRVYLATTNALADSINIQQLALIPGQPQVYEGKIKDKFTKDLPVEQRLQLKVGAQVMMVNNDKYKRWNNGTLAKITKLPDPGDEEGMIRVLLENGREEVVSPNSWEMSEFYFDSETREINTKSVGSYTQYPMKLAWAFTIHKSQGKTFDKVAVDLGKGSFAHGQVYVALSRCRSLSGLYLKSKIERRHIIVDPKVVDFMSRSF